jgi:hypothetical protein
MPPKTGVKVKFAGKQITLRYTAPALAKLEDHRGGEALALTLAKASQFSVTAVAALIWAGQLHEDQPLSYDDVLLNLEPPIDVVFEAVGKALEPWQEMGATAGKPAAAS